MTVVAAASRRFHGQRWTRNYAQGSRNAPPLNDALRHLGKVRLISENGQDCGIMGVRDALLRARALNLDLMQVSKAGTAVVRMVDYSAMESARRRSQYEARKQNKEARLLNRRERILKQVRLSPSTDKNDMRIKMRQAREFLKTGHQVKIYMQFRRGQGRLQENAKVALMAAAEELQEVGVVQGLPKDKGLKDLFREEKKEEEGEEVGAKKKPLEVLLRPLPRKERGVSAIEPAV